MKKALSFILVLVISLCSVSYSFALSDADYKKYKQESVKFAIADKDLSQTWKMIKGMNGGKIPSALMAEQKQWIQVERDVEAQKLFNTMSPADAYAAVTNQRIEILRTKWLMGSPTQGIPVQSNQGNAVDGDISGTYLGWHDGKYYKEDFIVIKKLGSNKYSVEIITNDEPRGGSCGFKGKGELSGDILNASTVEGGEQYILPMHIKSDNIIELPSDEHAGRLMPIFCGAISARSLEGVFKKR